MPQARSRSSAPWVTAAVAGAVLVALLVVYFVVFLPYRRDHGVGQLTGGELDAMQAATTELNDVGALGGKNFDTNYNNAIAGATGPFKQDLVQQRATAKKSLAGNGVQTQVSDQALVGPVQTGGPGYQLLMNLAGPPSTITGALLPPQQVVVTVVHRGDKWLVSDVRSAVLS